MAATTPTHPLDELEAEAAPAPPVQRVVPAHTNSTMATRRAERLAREAKGDFGPGRRRVTQPVGAAVSMTTMRAN